MNGMNQNYFNFFQLSIDATNEEVKSAYFKAAREFHPDRNRSIEAVKEFQFAQEAFDVLGNQARRKEYIQFNSLAEKDQKATIKKVLSTKSIPLLNEQQVIYSLFEITAPDSPANDAMINLQVCLLVDFSTSMSGKRLDMVKHAISKLVGKLSPADMISIVGFSDFANIIVPPIKARDFQRYESKLTDIQALGATEIFKALELGFNTIQGMPGDGKVKRIVLFTDGHTYGDEDACLDLAKKAHDQKISIYALGFGDGWNDEFLDNLTSTSGGNATLINSESDLELLLDEKVFSAERSYAQQINLEFEPSPGIELNYIFRLIPDASPLPIQNPIKVGNINFNQRMLFLFEFLIDPIPNDRKELEILKGRLLMEIPGRIVCTERHFIHWNRPVTKTLEKEFPPEAIIQSISRLTLYRMQEKIREDISQKNRHEASRKLRYLASQLKSQGENELAKTVLFEATQVETTGNFSRESDKRIKYGTRSLLLPSGLESDLLP